MKPQNIKSKYNQNCNMAHCNIQNAMLPFFFGKVKCDKACSLDVRKDVCVEKCHIIMILRVNIKIVMRK